ncbi:MAG: hypothetical protein JSR56_11575 [Proteobacteria bacterium]|nr:hypothetical protein [Pseudomonadota bacterium]
MKLSAISTAIVLAGIVGVASAAGQGKVMQPITVAGAPVSECAPPNDTTGHKCDAFNQLVRANFTPREIGMLFGYQTSYPASLSGGTDRLQRRYQAVLQQYVAAQKAATSGADVAAR